MLNLVDKLQSENASIVTLFIIKLSRGEKMKLGEKLYELRKEKIYHKKK